MIQHRIFAIGLVGVLFLAESALCPSHDQSRAGGVRAGEEASAALGHSPTEGAVGADAEWAAGIASRIEREEYRVSQAAGGLQAPNRAHNLRTHFRAGGIDVSPRQREERGESAAWQLTWRTTRWGRSSQLVDVESLVSEPRLEGERVTYAKGALDEWYENRKEGLEQGFTIHEQPFGDGPLIVAGQLGGGLRPQISRENGAIDLLDEHGARVLRYGELHVWDAESKELPSHFELDGIEVALVIEDDGAAYPLTIDPLLTSPSWTAESDQANAEFGFSVATAGDVNGDGFSDVIVGAHRFDNGQADEGRAYVFLGSPNGLSLTSAWTAEGDQVSAQFGGCVGSAGDVNGDGFHDVIVGGEGSQTLAGRAFVFLGSPSGLGLTPAWTVVDGVAGTNFGSSVGTAGDVNGDGFSDVIVGARYGDNGSTDEGLAYVYHGSASGLATTPAWIGECNQTSALFGFSVGTAGDVNGDGFSDVIVGAIGFDGPLLDEGRAFVYHGSAAGLATTAAWTGESNQTSAQHGWSVSTAGDVNGDGFSDVIVGALGYSNGESSEGRAFVYLGSGTGLAFTAAWTAESNQAVASFGGSVATAGDVNGDGFADVIVGASSYDNGQTNEGRASVYTGSASGLSTTAAWTAESNQGGAQLGVSVATAGDVNGDGYSDVIAGAFAYANGQTREGGAFAYHGSAASLATTAAWTTDSGQPAAFFGYSVASAGDVNGDGFSDVIVGAYLYDNDESGEGRAFVYHGSAAGLSTTAAWTAESNQADTYFGVSVATAGDVNGDGYSDVIVGAVLYDNGQTDEGLAFVYYGSAAGLAPTAAWTAESDQASAFFGYTVATAGDVNGDGFSDVIIGAPYYNNGQSDEGRTFVYHGSASGLATTAAWIAESDQAFASFGNSVATAGDVNGDGFSDVIVGAPYYDNGQFEEGRASVYHGSAAGLATTAAWTAESQQGGAEFGYSVATAGDVNGDGFSDVIVGSPSFDNAPSNEGLAFAYHGSAAGLETFAAWTADGGQPGARLGTSVATAGDVNGDGFSDVVVGTPYYDVNQIDEGRAFVYHGAAGGLSVIALWTPESAQARGLFGICVASAGDVNSDGFSDVIVGSNAFGADVGRALAYYGNAGDGLDRITRQARTDDSAPIQILNASNSKSAFRLKALGRTPAGRGKVRFQYEVEPFGTPFDGAGLTAGPIFDTGVPAVGDGSAIELSELVDGLNAETLYHWRLRFVSDSPLFPHSPWLTLAANGSTEADVRTASAITGVADASPVASGTLLEPSAPNPFSIATQLAYTLPDRGPVRLAVYDVSGREVALIADEVQNSGRHSRSWDGRARDGRDLPAGVYFTRLEFGGRVEARKLVLAR